MPALEENNQTTGYISKWLSDRRVCTGTSDLLKSSSSAPVLVVREPFFICAGFRDAALEELADVAFRPNRDSFLVSKQDTISATVLAS